MHKSLTRNLVLTIALSTLSGTITHADTTVPAPVPQSVTGGDPVPKSPHSGITDLILTWLQVLL